MKSPALKLFLALLCLFVVPLTQADEAQKKGLAIATEADKRNQGFTDSTADLIMELYNKAGDVSKRELRIKTLEVEGDGDKSLTIFDTPKDVQGTAFLTFSHKVGDDDQWLYLPKLKRVKRISSSNKSGPFMASEFSYEDLSSQELEKFTYRYLRDEVAQSLDCFVIERIPTYDKSGYKRQVVWLDKEEYRVIKTEFYNRRDQLAKTLTASGFNKYLDQYWRPTTMEMVNHLTGKKTVLTWNNYQFKTGLDDSDFNKNSLKRAR